MTLIFIMIMFSKYYEFKTINFIKEKNRNSYYLEFLKRVIEPLPKQNLDFGICDRLTRKITISVAQPTKYIANSEV